MDERFVSLATFVRAAAQAPAERALPAPAPADVAVSVVCGSAPASSVARGVIDFAHADVVHDLALMRLAALEAFESVTARLVESLARDVLERELMLAPADIDALVKRALATFSEHEPVSIAVSPADSERVHAPLPLRVDATLATGDLIVYVRDGSFESHFSFRLQEALERVTGAANR